MACDCEWVAESKSVEIHEDVLCCHFDAAHAQLVEKILVVADDRNDGDDGDDRCDEDDEEEEEKKKKK